ncbi:MAG: polysaccharide biosynthesis C-terminal domain-containing protein, partial [Floccifex sp.]
RSVLVGIIESIALCFGFIINLRSKKDFRFIVTFDYTALILSKSIPFVFADLSIVLYNEIDKIMLKNMLGNHQVGIYSIARNVGMLWDFIPLAFIQSIRPLMLKAIHEVDKTKIQMLNSAITCITSIICLAANIALLLFGKVYIALIYQENYLESSNYLSIFGISVFFSMVGCIGSIWLLGKELERYSAYRTIAGAILNGILNYILIPQYGIMGAALATLVTQIFVSIIYLFIINRTRDIVVMIFKGYSYAAKNGKKIIDIIFECGK